MKKIITLTILTSILATHLTTTQALNYKTKMYLGFGTAVVGGVSGAAAAIYFYNKAKNLEDETDPEFKKQRQMTIRQYKALAWLCGIGGVAIAAGGTLYGLRQKFRGPSDEQEEKRKQEIEAALERFDPDQKINYLIMQIKNTPQDSPTRHWAINKAHSIVEKENQRVLKEIREQSLQVMPEGLQETEHLNELERIENEIKRINREYLIIVETKKLLDKL